MTNLIQVHTTAGSVDEAANIANKLLEAKLAACVQIHGPIRSRYWWQGKLEESEEWVCTAKTPSDRYKRLEAAIREVHSYEEPEILATKIEFGSAGYVEWVNATVDDNMA